MLKRLALIVASIIIFTISAKAEVPPSTSAILINDGLDFDGAGASGTSPAPEFGNAGFFGGTLGGTDVDALNNSVAHRFDLTGFQSGSSVILTIVFNEFIGGPNAAGNDRLLVGFANSGTTANNSLVNLGNPQALANGGNVIVLDLVNEGFASGIIANGFLDILITDDSNVDFFTIQAILTPIPAALPLMATALMGGSLLARRRRKAVIQ